jgi:hypothetical protein
MRFSLGRSDVLVRLQRSCDNPQKRNNAITIDFLEDKVIHLEGMLYSQYGWALDLPNRVRITHSSLRLEDSIAEMPAPGDLCDKGLSLDSIWIINPGYIGPKPKMPKQWKRC